MTSLPIVDSVYDCASEKHGVSKLKENYNEELSITFDIDDELRKEQMRRLLKKSNTIGGHASFTHNDKSIQIQVNKQLTIWDLKVHYYDYIEETEGLDPVNVSLYILPQKEELINENTLASYDIHHGSHIMISPSSMRQKRNILSTSKKPGFVFHKLKLNLRMTFVVGRGLSHGLVGNKCYFNIYPITKLEKYVVSMGDEKFQISFTAADTGEFVSFPIEYKQNKNKIEISYIPDREGDFMIHIIFKKDEIGNSPYPLTVLPQGSMGIKELVANGWDIEASIKANKISTNPQEFNQIFHCGISTLKYLHTSSSDAVQLNMTQMLHNLLQSERSRIKLMMMGGIQYIACVVNTSTLWMEDILICKLVARVLAVSLQTNKEFSKQFFELFDLEVLSSLVLHHDHEIFRYVSKSLDTLTKSEENIPILLANETFCSLGISLLQTEDIVTRRYCLESFKNLSKYELFHKMLNSKYLEIIMELLKSKDRRIQLDSLVILSNIRTKNITATYLASKIYKCVYECFTTEGTLSWWEIGLFNCNPEEYMETHFNQSEHCIQSELNVCGFRYLNMIFSQATNSESKGIALHICKQKNGALLKSFCKLAGAVESAIQEEACKTLAFIATVPECRDQIISSGGIAWIMAAVRHIDHETQFEILTALAKISLSFTNNTKIPDENSFFPSLFKLIHSSEKPVQRKAAVILGHLMKNPNYRSLIFNATHDCLIDLLLQASKDKEISVHNRTIEWSDITIEEEIAVGAGLTKIRKCVGPDGKAYAIKMFDPNDIAFDIVTIHSEVCLMSVLAHRRIVHAISASLKPPNLFVISKLYAHGSVAELMKVTALDISLIVQMLIDAAEGIEYLHSMNIIHRDIKPGNFLVNDKFRVSVTDFGTTRVQAKRMTPVVGTAMYMAPDMIDCDHYTTKADVFSFSIVMWEMIERRMPYPDDMQAVDIVYYVKEGNRPEITIESPLKSLIKMCWDQEPEMRPSFTKILQYLRAIAVKYPEVKKPVISPVNETREVDHLPEIIISPPVPMSVSQTMSSVKSSNFKLVDSPSVSTSEVTETLSLKKKRESKRFKGGIVKMLHVRTRTGEKSEVTDRTERTEKTEVSEGTTGDKYDNDIDSSFFLDNNVQELNNISKTGIPLRTPETSSSMSVLRLPTRDLRSTSRISEIDSDSSFSHSSIGFEHSYSQDPIESDIPVGERDDPIHFGVTEKFEIPELVYYTDEEGTARTPKGSKAAKTRKIFSKTMIEQRARLSGQFDGNSDLSTSQDKNLPPEETKDPEHESLKPKQRTESSLNLLAGMFSRKHRKPKQSPLGDAVLFHSSFRQVMAQKLAFLAAVGDAVVGFAALNFFFENVISFGKIEGASMAPTLNDEDEKNCIVLARVWGCKPERGDVILIKEPSDSTKVLIKRLTSLPGDTVRFSKWKMDGERVDVTKKVPPGHVWIEGDNARVSYDSRQFGPVPAALIQGKVFFRIWPPSKIGPVHRKEIKSSKESLEAPFDTESAAIRLKKLLEEQDNKEKMETMQKEIETKLTFTTEAKLPKKKE